MKLSANAREYVKSEVKSAFADELKKAETALDSVKKSRESKLADFKGDYDELVREWKKGFVSLAKRHRLTLRDEDCFNIRVYSNYIYGGDVTCELFEETYCGNKSFSDAREAVCAVEEKIERAVQKALFEIEVHGNRNTIQEIVDSVIASIRAGK